jgi:GNAT superfamily N-acetyltransferase
MVPDDVGEVARLIRQMYPEEPGAVDPQRVRLEWQTFVARNHEAAIIGFLLGTRMDYGLASESHGTIVELVVDESHRRHGIGRALVDAWKSWVGEAGMNVGFLNAAVDAVPFYEACEFEVMSLPSMICHLNAPS